MTDEKTNEKKKKAELKLQPMNDLDVDKDGDVDFQDIKSIYKSKTFWVNVIAIVAFGLQSKYGYVIDESIQVQLLGIINIGLRVITNKPVTWK